MNFYMFDHEKLDNVAIIISYNYTIGRPQNDKNTNINLTQTGSNITKKNKTHLEKEKKSKVNIRKSASKKNW